MKKKSLLTVVVLFANLIGYAQQIGDGYAPTITNFSIPLLSGVYNGTTGVVGANPDVSHDWKHLLVIRHPNPGNNHQLQISSSFSLNDRIFFRKISEGLTTTTNPSWIELATRGANSFEGNQTIDNGDITLNTSTHNVLNFNNPNNTAFQYFNFNQNGVRKVWIGMNPDNDFYINKENGGDIVFTGANVGIGTANPDSKLTVKGKIHAEEIKVDLLVPADYVFQKYYTGTSAIKADYVMPTLAEVERFTKANNHLPNMPSAQEMIENGVELGEMNNLLLQKIEELTLYMIEQNKKIEVLEAKMNGK